MDVVLEKESGVAFAQELLDESPECRVLLISGFTDDVLITLPEYTGRTAFLRKPFTNQDLVTSVEALCR
jgi:FixJ family two-component response regulator